MFTQLQHFLPRLWKSPLFACGLTALLCLTGGGLLLQQQHESRLNTRTDHYGQALANIAAKQATDATFNHDLVSLQVTISEIARNPDVLNATVYDVENQLLVQAGPAPLLGDFDLRDHKSFTAPITLNDSVAGYVTIAIDQQALFATNNSKWLLALIALALSLIASSAFSVSRELPPPEPKEEPEPPEPEAPAEYSRTGAVQVGLSLCCQNDQTIRQQVNGAMRQQLYTRLELQINGLWPLYGGKVQLATDNGLELIFNGDDLGSTSFRALCAAQLLTSLLPAQQEGVALRYNAAVYVINKAHSLQEQMQQSHFRHKLWQLLNHLSTGTLLLDGQQCATSHTLPRLQTNSTLVQERWFVVQGFQPSYQALLEKQAQQITQLCDRQLG